MAEEEITRAKKTAEEKKTTKKTTAKKTTAKKTSTSKKESDKKTSSAKKTSTAKKTTAKKTTTKKTSTTIRLSKEEKALIKDYRECSELTRTLISAAVSKLAEKADKKEAPRRRIQTA